MLSRLRSSGTHFILTAGFVHLLLSVVVMAAVSSSYDPNSVVSIDRVFWAAILSAFAAPCVVIFQFCGNMYVANPLSDMRAGLLAVASGAVNLGVLKYFVGATIGI